MKTDVLSVFGRRLHNVDLRARNSGGVWQALIASRETNGTCSTTRSAVVPCAPA